MISLQDYLAMDACAMAEALETRQFTATQLVQCAIEQAQRVNPSINAICVSVYDKALEHAHEIDTEPQHRAAHKFAGIPFLIKDLANMQDVAFTRGSQLCKDEIADSDANIVARYRNAGLVIVGKSNTPEFGLTITTEPVANGASRNPWNLDYSTGGSSGGAAAAVAAGIVPVAHASDGGGSIRIPAACCGLFGLKPSRGLTVIESRMADCWSGLSVGHVVSRSVRDSAHFLDLIRLDAQSAFPLPSFSGDFGSEHLKSPESLRIGVQMEHPFAATVSDSCLNAVQQAEEICTSLGHQVENIKHPADFNAAARAMNKLICLHTFQAVDAQLTRLGTSLDNATIESSTRQMAEHGATISNAEYEQALEVLQGIAHGMEQFHQRYDLILSPVLSKETAKLGWLDMNSSDLAGYAKRFKGYSGFAALYNGTGQPSMSVPTGMTDSGLPLGVMFSGAWGSDLQLLQLAHQIEQAQPWPQLAPLADR